MSTQFWWPARAGGLVSWARDRVSRLGPAPLGRITRKPKPAWVLDHHRFLGALTVIFVSVHLLGLWLDSYVRTAGGALRPWRGEAGRRGLGCRGVLPPAHRSSSRRAPAPHSPPRGNAVHLTSFGLFAFATIRALLRERARHQPVDGSRSVAPAHREPAGAPASSAVELVEHPRGRAGLRRKALRLAVTGARASVAVQEGPGDLDPGPDPSVRGSPTAGCDAAVP